MTLPTVVEPNLVQNGTFNTDTSYWAQAGATSFAVVSGQLVAGIPARRATSPGLYDVLIAQNIPIVTAGQYQLTITAKGSVPVTIGVANGPVKSIPLTTTMDIHQVLFDLAAPVPAGQLQFLLGLASAAPWTFTMDNVELRLYHPPTLDVEYMPERGYVRFVVRNAPANYTVMRREPTGALTPIYGFEGSTWIASGDGFGEDYRPPIGDVATYALVPVGATFDDGTALAASVFVPGNQAWLRDVAHPSLSRPVTVVNTGEEQEPIQDTVYAISGRRLASVVHDVRNGRQGTITLLVHDIPERRQIEGLLSTGHPLLLSMCQDKGWDPCMMAVRTATFSRLLNRAMWTLALDYIEVDDPWVGSLDRIGDPIWNDIKFGRPHKPSEVDTAVTWAWVRSNFADWLSVAIGKRV